MSVVKMMFGAPPISDGAIDIDDSQMSAFRFLLNQREFPLPPARKATPKPVAPLRERVTPPRPDGWAPVKEPSTAVVAAQARNKAKAAALKQDDRPAYANGYPTTMGVETKPSQRRPEAANVVWKTYVDDYMLVLVSRQSVVDGVNRTVHLVVQAEWQSIDIEDQAQLEAANIKYFVRTTKCEAGTLSLKGVPLAFPSKKGWRVIEPFGQYLGPYDSLDQAEQDMRRWADELRLESTFHQDEDDPSAHLVMSDGEMIAGAQELIDRQG